MFIDQAKAEAHRRWGSPLSRGLVWIGTSGKCVVGYTDGEWRYVMGVGESWEDAFVVAEARRHRTP